MAFHDGDYSDLTTSTYIPANQIVSGHTDYYADVDDGTLSLAAGYYDLTKTGSNVNAYIYNKTTESFVVSSGANYATNLYVNGTDTYYLRVHGYTVGETYTVKATVSTATNDGDGTDLNATTGVSGGVVTGTGHTDYYADDDVVTLSAGMLSTGYYDLNAGYTGLTANTNILVYLFDKTTNTFVVSNSGSYTRDLEVKGTGHANDVYELRVYGYKSGSSYSATVTPNDTYKHDGDGTDLKYANRTNPSGAIWVNTGHTDYYADVDAVAVTPAAGTYWNINAYYGSNENDRSNILVYLYNTTTNTYVCSSGANYTTDLEIKRGNNYELRVFGYKTGSDYTATFTQNTTSKHDGDDSDLKSWTNPSVGVWVNTGHTDYYADVDAVAVTPAAGTYWNINAYYGSNENDRSNILVYLYNTTTNTYVCSSGANYTTDLEIKSGNNYELRVFGYKTGSDYTATFTQNTTSKHDGDDSDLNATTGANVYGGVTGTGHTEYYADVDAVSVSLNAGYYDLNAYYGADSTNHSNILVYLSNTKTSTYVCSAGANYTKDLEVKASDTYELRVFGYKAGDSYTAVVKSTSTTETYDDMGSLTVTTPVTGHTDFISDVDHASLNNPAYGYYSVAVTAGTADVYVFDKNTTSYVVSSTGSYQTNLQLFADHTYTVNAFGSTVGSDYTVALSKLS